MALGVAASLLGLGGCRRAGAQQNVPIGGRCSAFGANAECSQAGTPTGGVPVICSDNGIARDGQFNCCRNAGGVCTADFHCCGAALCINGSCGGSDPSTGLPLGAECTSTSQCSQTGGSVVCADNGLLRDGASNCCRNQGGSCTVDFQCCAALFCINGLCGGSSSSNLSPGSACTSTSECSQAGGSVVCADNQIATDGALNCCRNTGGACANSAGCCAGLACVGGICGGGGSEPPAGNQTLGAVCSSSTECSQVGGAVACADNGYVDDGALNCCRNEGGPCFDSVRSADCCSGLYCRNGVCTDLSVTGDLPPGSACTASDQCSQVGGAVICAYNGIATGGDLNCCRNEGGACTLDAGCCGGATCSGGVCGSGSSSSGGLALGASCTASSQCSQSGGSVACADNGIASDGDLNCCRYQGGTCAGGAACCGGLECVGGVCGGGGASGGDLPPGSACTSDDQCSQAGGEVACRDNGLASDGERNCCRYTGGACTAANNSAGCCAGLVCVDGTCQ